MAKYLVKKPIQIGDGFMNNEKGDLVPMKSLLPQPNTILEGNIQVRDILGNKTRGLPYEIKTKVNAQLMTSTVMIGEEYLEMMEADKPTQKPIITVVTEQEQLDIFAPKKNVDVNKNIELKINEQSQFPIFDLLGYLFNN